MRTMLAEAKDTSELMVDLAYAALYFNDPDMADEVASLEAKLNQLVYDMRALCIVAVRHPREAESMAAVLQVVAAVERIGDDAVDITRIVTRKLGIPNELLQDLADAEEVSHRLVIQPGSSFASQPLSAFELPTTVGMRVMAVRRERDWIVDPKGDFVLVADDVLIFRGSPDAIPKLRELAGAPEWRAPEVDDSTAITDLDRAIDTLVEMKDLSEVAVGLAYSTLVLQDRSLAAQVRHLEDRLDEMNNRLELWVLRAAGDYAGDPAQLRGLLQLSRAAEDIGDQAQQMVWLVERSTELHPVLGMALGDADDIFLRLPIGSGSQMDGISLQTLRLPLEPGYTVLAIERDDRYQYRPRGTAKLQAGDHILATGPEEGQEALAEMAGWRLVEDEDTGEIELEPLGY
ncbi:MAG: potassium channel family protein [Acidimicrobiia bacterium]